MWAWLDVSIAVSMLALACSVSSFVLASRAYSTSVPARIRKQANEAIGCAEDALRGVESLAASWAAKKNDLSSIQESIDDTLDRVERKRRSAAAAASRAANPHPENGPVGGTPEEQVAFYRSKVMGTLLNHG